MSSELKMSSELTMTNAIEQALIQGNLASLTPSQRVHYYNQICESIGLNPMTRPFEYLTLNGKLTLYARKDCTDQLRSIKSISIEKPDITFQDEWIIVSVTAKDATGRSDSDIGVVNKKDMRGDFGNAVMKAVTKAKRRVTLSMCGLGMLDESEVESIPAARTYTAEEAHGGEVVTDPRQLPGIKTGADLKQPRKPLPGETDITAAKTLDELATAFRKAKWITEDDKQHLIALKDRRKAELTEGEQSRPPSASSATGPVAAASATTVADGVANHTPEPSASDSLPPRPARGPTAKSLSDLIEAVAEATGDDETHIIGELCRTMDAPDLDSMDAAQRGGADAWLRERAKMVTA